MGKEYPILETLLPHKPKIRLIGHPDVNISVDMRRRKYYSRDAPFAEYRCGVWT